MLRSTLLSARSDNYVSDLRVIIVKQCLLKGIVSLFQLGDSSISFFYYTLKWSNNEEVGVVTSELTDGQVYERCLISSQGWQTAGT